MIQYECLTNYRNQDILLRMINGENPNAFKSVLSNGLTVIGRQMPSLSSVAMGIWIGAGSRYETAKINGISHFLEHLLFKGTKKRSGEQLKQAIEGVGGSFNGFTSEEATCYLVKVVNKHTSLGLDILSDMVKNPLLKEADIEKERRVIIQEIKMYEDLPSHYVHELFGELLWPDHPLGRNIAGTLQSVSSIKRKALLDYWEEYYQTGNSVFSISGNFKKETILSQIEGYFGKIKKGKRKKFLPAKRKINHPQIKLNFKETEQAHLCLGGIGLSRNHPDRYTLELLSTILGGNMSSRLFREVREKRSLAYAIRAESHQQHDTGAFVVSAGVAPERTKEALRVILKELKKIKEKNVSPGELKRAKDFLLGQLTLSLEDSSSYMLWLGSQQITEGRTETFKEVKDCINRVEEQDLKRIASLIFQNSNLKLALIGPLKNKEELFSFLKL